MASGGGRASGQPAPACRRSSPRGSAGWIPTSCRRWSCLPWPDRCRSASSRGWRRQRAVQRLETRGLVTTEQSGRRLEVAIAHPLHAEVLRSSMPALRQRSIRRNLVDALLATGARRSADRVRSGVLVARVGLDVDPMTLSLGSDASLFGDRPRDRRSVDGDPARRGGGAPDGRPGVRQDNEVAIRLARAAYERPAVCPRVSPWRPRWRGPARRQSAEAVLADLADKAAAIDDRVRVALGLAWVRFWGRYHVDEARAGLDRGGRRGRRCGCDPNLLAESTRTSPASR